MRPIRCCGRSSRIFCGDIRTSRSKSSSITASPISSPSASTPASRRRAGGQGYDRGAHRTTFAWPRSARRLISRTREPDAAQDLIGHACINLRLPTYGGLYAWEFEKGGRELKVRVEGQLTFNGTFQMLKAALAGFGIAYVPEDLGTAASRQGPPDASLGELVPLYAGYHLYYPSRRQPSAAFALLGRGAPLSGVIRLECRLAVAG